MCHSDDMKNVIKVTQLKKVSFLEKINYIFFKRFRKKNKIVENNIVKKKR